MNFLKFKVITIFSLIIWISLSKQVNSFENKILLKVNNEIVTSLDILRELEYLHIINNEFKNVKKEEAIEISKNSIIREKIKEIEIKRIIKEIKREDKILENLIINYFKEFEIKSISEFENYFLNRNIDPDEIKKKFSNSVIDFISNSLK